MSTQGKILAGVVVIFFVCLVAWVVLTTPPTPPPIEKVAPPTVMEYEGNTITEEKDGQIIWELSCDKLRVDTLTQNMELDNVRGKFYQHDKEKIWELTASRGVYYQSEKIVRVEDEVIVTNSDGAKLLCDELEWHSEQELLTAIDNVSVTTNDGKELLCSKLMWNFKDELLTATDNVKITNSDGAKLWSDKIDWFTAEEKVIATGNVRISKDDMRGFGDLAYSENNFKKFGLLGNARVLKGVKDTEEGF